MECTKYGTRLLLQSIRDFHRILFGSIPFTLNSKYILGISGAFVREKVHHKMKVQLYQINAVLNNFIVLCKWRSSDVIVNMFIVVSVGWRRICDLCGLCCSFDCLECLWKMEMERIRQYKCSIQVPKKAQHKI